MKPVSVLLLLGLFAASANALETLEVKRGAGDARYMADGMVEAVRASLLAAQTAGRIVERSVEAGDRVHQGQLLIRIDDREAQQSLVASQAQAEAARAQLQNTSSELERTRALFARQLVSQAALDRAESAQRAALAQLQSYNATAGVSATQTSFKQVLAPYEGVVAAVQVQVGDMAVPGKPLLSLYDPRAMRIHVALPASQLQNWQREQPLSVQIGTQILQLSRTVVLPLTDPDSQLITVRIELPPQTAVLPGQLLKVGFAVRGQRGLMIPQSALIHRGELTAVYIVASDGRLQLRQVRTGAHENEQIEIVAGLNAGEKIARDPVAATADSGLQRGAQ